MGSPAARQNDTDDKGHTITGGCVSEVRIDGSPAAVKGSTMDDGVSINGGTVATVRINGQPAAVKGSTTEPHVQNPHKNESGTINSGASAVNIG